MIILLLCLAPFGTGLLINSIVEKEHRSIGITYLSGFLVLLAVFQLLAVPVVFLDAFGFPLIVKIFTVLTTLLTGGGILSALHLWRREGVVFRENVLTRKKSRVELVQWLIVVILIGFQVIMALTHASFDGDDAYYVVQSLVTDETDTLYRILPYTGFSTSLDMRHAMAVFPVWIAYLARMTGIHATILSHTILPVVLIPLTYLIYYEIGKVLFREKEEQISTYMLYMCFLQIFGNVSIYTNATFFLTRTWQGKSMFANVVIPAVFMVLLWLFEGEPDKRGRRRGLWVLLFTINIVAAMMSTASVFLNTLLIGVMSLVLCIQEKNIKIMLRMIGCCIPCAVYALLYVFL